MATSSPPRDRLVRAVFDPPMEVRAAEDGAPGLGTLRGHFAVFNQWTEINSLWEGNFMERIAPGAFKKTLSENKERIKVLYDHGQDPSIGNKPLGTPAVLREDDDGAYYEVPLFDTSYNRDLLPSLKAGALGASFRFQVMREEFDKRPKRSDDNPDGIPERTLQELRLHEFGPVTFPAYEGATAGMRSLTDLYMVNSDADLERLERLLAAKRTQVAIPMVTSTSSSGNGVSFTFNLGDSRSEEHDEEPTVTEPEPEVEATTPDPEAEVEAQPDPDGESTEPEPEPEPSEATTPDESDTDEEPRSVRLDPGRLESDRPNFMVGRESDQTPSWRL